MRAQQWKALKGFLQKEGFIMSFNYMVEGYMSQQRRDDGSFLEGSDLLPARLPAEDKERMVKDNPGCADVIAFHYINAYNSIQYGLFGDANKCRFRISLSGHANPSRDNTGTGYVKDCCSTTVSQL